MVMAQNAQKKWHRNVTLIDILYAVEYPSVLK